MADTYIVDKATGLPFKVSENQIGQLSANKMARAIPQQEYEDLSRAQQYNQIVDESPGKAALYGLGSGLTLGIGPGLAAAGGFVDPELMQAMQESPYYTGGDIVGTIAPALFSGGESLAAREGIAATGLASRGLLGRALGMTPAGLMGAAGGLSERIAARFLPEAGSLAGRSLKMAARGATEGALINMGHTIGDNLIQDKPFSAEAMLASGADGALFGALIGGSAGVVGSVGSKVGEYVPGAAAKVGRAAEGKAEGIVSRRLGYTAGEFEEMAAKPGGVRETIKSGRELLEKEGSGVTFGSKTGELKEAYGRVGAVEKASMNQIVSELEKYAPASVPSTERVMARLDSELLSARQGTILEKKTVDFLGKIKEELVSTEPKWSKWVATRNELVAREATASGLEKQFLTETRVAVQDEIKLAMEAASEKMGSKGLAAKFEASQAAAAQAKAFEEVLGRKSAQELLASETTFTPRDLAVFGGMAAIGHPGTALGWMAAKGVGRRLNSRLEPWMAEMAYKQSIGSRAAGAETKAKIGISNGIKKFFSNAVKTGRVGASVVKAEKQSKPAQKYDRKAFEEAVSRTEQLLSGNHQARVMQMVQNLEQMGYGQFAKSLFDANQRAVQYMQFNMPQRRAVKSLGSLRPQPAIHGLDMKEYKFLRTLKGVTDPFAIIEDLNSGQLSRDQVRAVKYVYPEIHSRIVKTAAEEVAAVKASGKFLPMDKIMHLGLVLDSPIDSTQEPGYVSTVQQALKVSAESAANSPAPPPQPEIQTLVPNIQTFGTPIEQALV